MIVSRLRLTFCCHLANTINLKRKGEKQGRREEEEKRKRSRSSALSRAEKAERLQRVGNPRDQFVPVTPDRRVDHAVLTILHARLLQRAHAVGAVVLELRVFGLDRIAGASGAQARKREMVVQSDHALRIVEAFDVLIRLREVLRAIDVLQHMHVPTKRRMFESKIALLSRIEIS